MKKNILITGGLGFIGNNIIRHLLKTTDYSFTVLDKQTYAGRIENLPDIKKFKKRIKIIKGDVTKKIDVKKALKHVSIVIHMAAETHTSRSIAKPIKSLHTNVLGTAVVLEVASKFPIEKFIYISSSEVYGDQGNGIEMDENHPLVPVSPYAVSKLAGDRLTYSFYLTKKLPVVILRFFNAYGPRQHTEKAIPRFITNLLENKPITVNHGGKQTRDWVYVEDHARALEKVVKADTSVVIGQVFNIGTGTAVSVTKITELIVKELKKDMSLVKIIPSTDPGTNGNIGISKKAEKILGWKSEVTIEEGIKKTVFWYKTNKKWWKTLKKST